ncbi:LysR family transcriptional regulator [Corynebacterium variabile]|uniref:LysR family transcriptional regulator n=1 Tax=Corynebacterium variabile TaxID=1727 RepID=UPI003FD55C0A
MRPTLEQVEVFVLAARHGSFSGAARAMGRSQSTVSTSIANLEIALDTELFDRSSRFPVLTTEGETLLQEAKALYDRGLAFERHGDSLSQGQPTNITLAVGIPTASSPLCSPGSRTSSLSSTCPSAIRRTVMCVRSS